MHLEKNSIIFKKKNIIINTNSKIRDNNLSMVQGLGDIKKEILREQEKSFCNLKSSQQNEKFRSEIRRIELRRSSRKKTKPSKRQRKENKCSSTSGSRKDRKGNSRGRLYQRKFEKLQKNWQTLLAKLNACTVDGSRPIYGEFSDYWG